MDPTYQWRIRDSTERVARMDRYPKGLIECAREKMTLYAEIH